MNCFRSYHGLGLLTLGSSKGSFRGSKCLVVVCAQIHQVSLSICHIPTSSCVAVWDGPEGTGQAQSARTMSIKIPPWLKQQSHESPNFLFHFIPKLKAHISFQDGRILLHPQLPCSFRVTLGRETSAPDVTHSAQGKANWILMSYCEPTHLGRLLGPQGHCTTGLITSDGVC